MVKQQLKITLAGLFLLCCVHVLVTLSLSADTSVVNPKSSKKTAPIVADKELKITLAGMFLVYMGEENGQPVVTVGMLDNPLHNPVFSQRQQSDLLARTAQMDFHKKNKVLRLLVKHGLDGQVNPIEFDKSFHEHVLPIKSKMFPNEDISINTQSFLSRLVLKEGTFSVPDDAIVKAPDGIPLVYRFEREQQPAAPLPAVAPVEMTVASRIVVTIPLAASDRVELRSESGKLLRAWAGNESFDLTWSNEPFELPSSMQENHFHMLKETMNTPGNSWVKTSVVGPFIAPEGDSIIPGHGGGPKDLSPAKGKTVRPTVGTSMCGGGCGTC